MFRARPVLLGALWALGACAAPPESAPDPHDLPLLGTKPLAPLPKVSFTMPDMWGEPFDLRAETDGHITLLFFGYTYCPDVCPLQMATLAAALKEVPDVRALVRLVFVTVDPERDTPTRLRQWLSAFDTTFIGVRGTPAQIAEALAFYRYPPPEFGPEKTGYLVGHPALVYAFTPDDRGRAMYGVETREATWVHDLTLMAGADWTTVDTATSVREVAGTPGVLGSAGAVLVLDATVAEPAAGATAALYLTLLNTGAETDTLVGVSAETAASASLHETRVEGGVSMMQPLDRVTLPPGTTVRLKPGGIHGMLEGLDPVPVAGDTLRVTLEVRAGGRVTVEARVVPYAEVAR